MRVYKFLPAKYAVQDLLRRQIKISTFPDMNDPFELLGGYCSDSSLREHLNELISHWTNNYGALCFSRHWQDPVLWSHYGDKHRGICLGFDIASTVEVQKPFYVANRVTLDRSLRILLNAAPHAKDLDASDAKFQECVEIFKQMLLTKFERWDYEDEVRVLFELKEEQRQGSLYFAELEERIQPSEMILGIRCSISEKEIEKAINCYSTPIRVVRAELSPSFFQVIEHTIRP